MDDSKIIDLYFERSEDAIRETAIKYGKLCYRVAFNLIHNRSDAEECVNDVYLGAWNAIPPANPQILSSFLCRVTRNLALKKVEYLYAQKRNPKFLTSLDELEECVTDKNCDDIRYSDEQLSNIIKHFLYSLDVDNRNVFIRRYWYFDSIKNIAKGYHMSKSKVESMLFRTRNNLREYLMKEGFNI